jgi:hypothetical protein
MLPKSIIWAALFLLLNLSTTVYASPIPEAEAAFESYIKVKGAKDTIGDVERLNGWWNGSLKVMGPGAEGVLGGEEVFAVWISLSCWNG